MDLFSENPTIFTVSQLRETLNNVINEAFSGPILVRGVISSIPKQYPQFVFFDLKDEKKNQFFTVFAMKNNFLRAEAKLRDAGLVDKLTVDVPVMLIAKIKVSTQKQIAVRLVMEDIVPDYTKSLLKNQKDETLEKLQKEGLLSLQKQIQIPRLIKKIAVITSDQGTSLKDIRSAIGVAQKYIDIVFVSTRVEGASAINGVIDAIKRINKFKLDVDLILLARGGGSTVDLAVFNDYNLCKEVTKSKIPIIAAIGHDKDELAVEFASYNRPNPATPSGAGSFIRKIVLNNFLEFRETFSLVLNLTKSSYDMNITKINENISLVLSLIKNALNHSLEKILTLISDIKNNIIQVYDNEQKYLSLLTETVQAYNHKQVLKRGYAVVWSGDKAVKLAKNVKQKMQIEFYDDKIMVERVQNDKQK